MLTLHDLRFCPLFGLQRFPMGIRKANTCLYVSYHGVLLFCHRFGGTIIVSIKI